MSVNTDTRYATIKVSPSTRDTVRELKRGGESYDDLLAKMAKQYNPKASN